MTSIARFYLYFQMAATSGIALAHQFAPAEASALWRVPLLALGAASGAWITKVALGARAVAVEYSDRTAPAAAPRDHGCAAKSPG